MGSLTNRIHILTNWDTEKSKPFHYLKKKERLKLESLINPSYWPVNPVIWEAEEDDHKFQASLSNLTKLCLRIKF